MRDCVIVHVCDRDSERDTERQRQSRIPRLIGSMLSRLN
jgi:hypothetical protein